MFYYYGPEHDIHYQPTSLKTIMSKKLVKRINMSRNPSILSHKYRISNFHYVRHHYTYDNDITYILTYNIAMEFDYFAAQHFVLCVSAHVFHIVYRRRRQIKHLIMNSHVTIFYIVLVTFKFIEGLNFSTEKSFIDEFFIVKLK